MTEEEPKTMCGPPPEGWRLEGCKCAACESYGESQEGKPIHFVSKEAEKGYWEYLTNPPEEEDPWGPWTTADDDPVDPDDPIDPDHYHTSIEPIDFIMANGLDFCEGCVVKYITRWRKKGGVKDLLKAKRYIEFLIEAEKGKE